MAYNRGYQPNPWASGAPPNQQAVMSGLMTTGGYQPTGPQNHFANPTGAYSLAGGNGISWNMQGGNVPNGGQMRMGQPQAGWNQGVVVGNQQRIGNQRTPNKRNANWNDNGHQIKRQNKGPMNNNRNVPGGMNKNNQQQNRNNNNRGNLNNRNYNNNVNRNNQNNNNQNLKKRNQNQTNRPGQNKHQLAQRAAQNLNKKEYPIKRAVATDGKVKNEDFDSIQGHYVVSVYGFCCKLCDVFLKDKVARNEHVKLEEHLKKFNAAEEEKKAKKLAKTKAKAEEKAEGEEKAEQTNGEATTENTEEAVAEEENVENEEEEEEEQAEDSNVTENGNEEEEVEEAVADTSEVTEESKNLQQSIQQDLAEDTPQKKVNQPKKNFKQANRGAKGGRPAANRGGRGGNRGKRAN